MNVASLELCKELYELSGWKTGVWYWTNGPYSPEESLVTDLTGYQNDDIFEPAYTLGYLARKLPHGANLEIGKSSIGYVARWEGVAKHSKADDTPEDAACKLCCELIRQGIIKP